MGYIAQLRNSSNPNIFVAKICYNIKLIKGKIIISFLMVLMYKSLRLLYTGMISAKVG